MVYCKVHKGGHFLLVEKRAETIKQAREIAKGYTWYTNTLFPKKGIEGAKQHSNSDNILCIKVEDQYLIFYKEAKQ